MKNESYNFDELTEAEQKMILKYRSLTQEQKAELWRELALCGAVVEASDHDTAPKKPRK